ncbi:MAG: rhomboid family intramembrane serine protease [Planctomycetaceae bacterium]|nr:rhomboid family intramembrane serine protease [Planctomycetaceae bacterium]
MRQIGKLPSRSSAQVLVDYLLAQGITTKLEQVAGQGGESEQWILWGMNEDQIDTSRAIYNEYVANPEDPRFREARGTAKNLRKQEQAVKTRRERQMFDANRLWSTPRMRDIPVVTSCIVISVTVSLLTGFGNTRLGLLDKFYYRPQTTQDLHFPEEILDMPLRPPGMEDDPTETHDLGFQRFKEALIFSKTISRERPKNPDVAILKGEVWRLVTPIFLHFSGMHLLFNMMWLYTLGGVLEVRRGSWKILGMILLIGMISNAAQAHSSPNLFGGMSGVVYGLFCFLWLGRIVDPGIGIGVSQQQVVLMMVWMFMGFSMPQMNMANWAHLGGALSGAGLALGMGGLKSLRKGNRSRWV